MNKTQVNNFLKCLLLIDDISYLSLHKQSTDISNASRSSNNTLLHNHQHSSYVDADDDHDHEHDHDHDHEHEHEHEHSSSHDLLVAKITAMVVLFCASALCGYVPFLLNRCFKWTEKDGNARSAFVVKCLLYFGGGVLLCTTFLHLLPEVHELVETLTECGTIPTLTFPLAELLMCAGFFLMYFIEELIHTCLHRHARAEQAAAAFERGHSVRNSYLVKGGESGARDKGNEGRMPQSAHEMSADSGCRKGTLESSGSESNNATTATLSVQDLIAIDVDNQKYNQHMESAKDHYHCPHYHQQQHKHHHHQVHVHESKHHSHSHMPNIDNEDLITSSLRGLFIVLALSLHELFEGMAIGLEGAASSVWFMFGAVSAHKLVLAFCVGVELIVARTRMALSIVYILTFAIVSPIGISIGILISRKDEAEPGLTSAILQGLACGTLLYVVFFEILSKNHGGLGSYLALLVGYVIMFGLQQITSVGHGHSHGGSCGGSRDIPEIVATETIRPTQYNADKTAFERQLQLLRQASFETLQRT